MKIFTSLCTSKSLFICGYMSAITIFSNFKIKIIIYLNYQPLDSYLIHETRIIIIYSGLRITFEKHRNVPLMSRLLPNFKGGIAKNKKCTSVSYIKE
jgi:hypothetical protein